MIPHHQTEMDVSIMMSVYAVDNTYDRSRMYVDKAHIVRNDADA